MFGGWTNEQPTTSQTADDDWGNFEQVWYRRHKQRYAGKHTVSMPPSSCLVCSYCRVQECVKAAGSEFRRIKKEHPGGVAEWLLEQNAQPTPSAKPKRRLGSLTRATDITKASRFPPLVLSSCFDEHGNRVAECPLKEVDNVMCLGSDCSSPWHTQPQKWGDTKDNAFIMSIVVI